MAFDGITIAGIVNEIAPLLAGGRINKIAQPETDELIITIKNNEVWLKNAFIKPYEKTTSYIPDQNRNRKLLLNRQEIDKLQKQTIIKGNALIPLKVILKNGLVKIEIGLGKGKKLYDKKDTLKNNDIKRAMEREIRYI